MPGTRLSRILDVEVPIDDGKKIYKAGDGWLIRREDGTLWIECDDGTVVEFAGRVQLDVTKMH